MGRIGALDWGSRRIGVAVSDEERMIAHQTSQVFHNNAQFNAEFKKFLQRFPLDKLLVGLPTTLSGKPSASEKQARVFAQALSQNFSLEVEFVDERFSSRRALQKLRAAGFGKAVKDQIDNAVAQELLQAYLDKLKTES